MRIEELWGFGSVIRGKESPGDIDLVAKYSSFHPAYEAFKPVSQEAIKKYGWENDCPPTPKDALLQYMSSLPDDIAKKKILFASWLEGVTWGVLFKDMIPDMYGWEWESITKRILHRGLRGIHVMRFAHTGDKAYLNAKAYQLFWSRDKPDLYSNLQLVFSSEEIRKSCLTELENFETQLAPLKIELEIIGHLFPRLLRYDSQFKSINDCTIWLMGQAKEAFRKYPETVLKQLIEHGKVSDPQPIPTIQAEIPLNSLKEQVENKRKEVKQLQQEREVLSMVLWSVKELKSGMPGVASSKLQEQVALRTIKDVPKYFVEEAKIRECLRKLSLPENKVETVKYDGSRTHYRFKHDDEM